MTSFKLPCDLKDESLSFWPIDGKKKKRAYVRVDPVVHRANATDGGGRGAGRAKAPPSEKLRCPAER